jgi:hypothetical protein
LVSGATFGRLFPSSKKNFMKTSILTTIVLILTLSSCTKDVETILALMETWEVKDFMSIESIAYPKNENSKILLTFEKAGSYHLKLDINSCSGPFTLGKNHQLEIKSTACTEACCDSKFSEKLAEMLLRVESYSIEGTTLKLNVPQWGWIECELVE